MFLGPHGHIRGVAEIDPALATTPEGVQHLRKLAAANGASRLLESYQITRPTHMERRH